MKDQNSVILVTLLCYLQVNLFLPIYLRSDIKSFVFDVLALMNGPQQTACLGKGYNNNNYKQIEVLVMGKNQ